MPFFAAETVHPTLRPLFEDEAMSANAPTDHGLALAGRNQKETSPWVLWLRGLQSDKPFEPHVPITNMSFWEFAWPQGENGKLPGLAERTKNEYLYGREVGRRLVLLAMNMSKKVHMKGPVSEIDSFDWLDGQKGKEPERVHVEKMGQRYRDPADDVRVYPSRPVGPAIEYSSGPETRGLTRAQVLALSPPPRALPAPPKGLPKPRADDQR